MEAVGYDLYCKLLNEAVSVLKGTAKEDENFETVVDCDIDAYIPPSYIKNEYQKLDIYKRISGIETEDEYMDMQDELIDRFGDIPRPVENLLRVAELKAMAHRCYVTEIDINRQEIRISMYPKAKLDTSGTVSYTHLDVYKRQPAAWSRGCGRWWATTTGRESTAG